MGSSFDSVEIMVVLFSLMKTYQDLAFVDLVFKSMKLNGS